MQRQSHRHMHASVACVLARVCVSLPVCDMSQGSGRRGILAKAQGPGRFAYLNAWKVYLLRKGPSSLLFRMQAS